ncbi:allantoin permease [Rathayibacter rathayi]|uniref:Allantoin permease n=1 Tax=Rathayibacter rathayi TaxID=33887 RepID=A0ABD6W979_RATRA|nr:cytosine permease [Rathayibacter rathayi]PPF14186.1 allantoin permease [Rathayibacter rathayi]PPH25211.1 allantoin permease [Rathayibacter rathayi]
MTSPDHPSTRPAGGIEFNGLDTIQESERHGRPRDLFWPWFAANVSVLGLSYGSFLLGFGLSFWQATLVGVIGIVVSFLFCGLVAVAGKRGSAPTMVLSRAAFGVDGNRLVSVISWLLTVGWETVLASLAVLATATVFEEFGWDGGVLTKVVALIVVATLIVVAGIAGFRLIMRLQLAITIATAVLTVVYVVLVLDRIDLAAIGALPAGSTAAVIGGLVFMMTGFGLGWVNAAADYSRYLPREARTSGVVAWTTIGGAAAPVLLVVVGLLLAGSSQELSDAIAADPIGALAGILPTWFLLPFIVVALLGLIGGAVMNIYSSGLALLSTGLKVSRPVAAGIDGVLMVLGAVYVVFVAGDFLGPFQGFLITLGVPIAAWLGVFLADLLLRRRDYDQEALYDSRGRYRSVSAVPVALVLVGTLLGWGLVVNYSPGFEWEGYLLGPLGGREGDWAGANLGVLLALVIGFAGTLALSRTAVRRQEASA